MSKVIFADNNKRIGKVLFIVEGIKTEINILHRIFTKIFDYQYEKLDRLDRYRPYNKKDNPLSSIFVINTEESNIKYIDDASGYLDNLFTKLINDYKFPVDKAAIFYIFDRDNYSNTNENLVVDLINRLGNSRESNDEYDRQGLLLLSYPSIESFTASNYIKNSFNLEIEKAIKNIGIESYDLDNFKDTNLKIYNYEENHYRKTKKYKLLSLLCAALLDLGLIAIEED